VTDQTGPAERARRRILDRHGAVVDRVDECAADVAATWEGDTVTDRSRVVDPFERRLRDAGVLSLLPAALADAVDAAGYDLAAEPVAAPPYVVVTSTGPVLRATVADGRLVVAFRPFEVVRDRDGDDGDESGGVRYARRDADPASAVEARFRDR
jgi:hypothetical protein